MNLAVFTLIDLRRIFVDWAGLFFTTGLPVLFYLLFGAMQTYADAPFGEGNVAAYIMVGMAVYGGVTSACSTVGSTAVEQTTGWGRQLALTPLGSVPMLVSKTVVILVRAAFPVAAVNIAGIFTSAEMPAATWVTCAVVSVLAALPFGFYGMIFGILFRSESAVSIASTSVVILAFLGNSFSPLPEFLMGLARFSPMYGATSLARYPLSEGQQAVSDVGVLVTDPLWYAVANVIAWTIVFAAICALLARKKQKGRR
ncbi:ABC transporter permease [Rothia sp. AR01]|uniref:ABC transporter permease n=1 Tax=Rothia santali TaxID=2949643 RepID=A0A9X2KGG7_9MICC|nr:ABC transporter permease [Rothia santali]MCP3424837.1 ABC transporter permease [Rothia santali]